MKVPTVAVALPSRGTMHSRTIEALLAAIEYAESARVVRRVDDWACFAHGLPIPTSHERAAERALATGADLVWFVEEDNVPPVDALFESVCTMQQAGAGMVAVDYPVGEPRPRGNGVRWGSVYREGDTIQFCGLGITLIRRDVFEALSRPWFRIDRRMALVRDADGNRKIAQVPSRPMPSGGVDVYFGLRVRDLGVGIVAVPGMVGGHLRLTSLGKYPLNVSPHVVELWETIDSPQHLFAGTDSSRFGPDPEWSRGFKRLGPWVSGFDLAGAHFGGKYDAVNDPRVGLARDRFPDVIGRRVLELGALEGGHTVALSRWADEVVAIEGRAANVAKARYVLDLHGVPNAELLEANLETFDLTTLGDFDLVFCVGLLYHLPNPLRLLDQIAKVAPRLFLWTHHGGNGPRQYTEFGLADPLSGLSPVSTWLARDHLLAELAARYDSVDVLSDEQTNAGPAITVAATRTL